MLEVIYRPQELTQLPDSNGRRISVGAGRRSMTVVNRSPFWFMVTANGIDPVEIVPAWNKVNFPIPNDTRTFRIVPWTLNGQAVLDWTSDLVNMVLVDASCDSVGGTTTSAIISASVPLAVSEQSPLGSTVTVESLVPFTGTPEQFSVDPADNAWLYISGNDNQLQRETDVAATNPITHVWYFGANAQGTGTFLGTLVPAEEFFTNIAGETATYNEFGPESTGITGAGPSNVSGPIIAGASVPGGSLSGYTITSPLGLQLSQVLGNLIYGGTSGSTTKIGQTSPASSEVIYLYTGQKVVLWCYIDDNGESGMIGFYDAANPANGCAYTWTANAQITMSAPGIAIAYPNQPPSAYVDYVMGMYDVTGATVEFAPSTQYAAKTSLHGHSLTRLYLGNAPVSKVNPIPVSRQIERISKVLTTATLGANASYTQNWIDTQNPQLTDQYGNIGPTIVNAVSGFVYSDQEGTIYLDATEDTANANLTVTKTVSVTAGQPTRIPLTFVGYRYVRFRYTNGGTAQGSFELTQTAYQDYREEYRPSGRSYQETGTALGASATYTGAWHDAHYYGWPYPVAPLSVSAVSAMVYTDQAGTLYLDQTDNTADANLIISTSVTISAATPASLVKTALIGRYFRFRLVNGATAQTTLDLQATAWKE